MISKREAALLQAAATIYGGITSSPHFDGREGDAAVESACVESAYALLDLIQSREKANLSPREAVVPHTRPRGACESDETPTIRKEDFDE